MPNPPPPPITTGALHAARTWAVREARRLTDAWRRDPDRLDLAAWLLVAAGLLALPLNELGHGLMSWRWACGLVGAGIVLSFLGELRPSRR